MLRLALFFLVVSIVAAIFGFGGIAAASADIARILFFIAIVIFVVLLVAGLMAGSTLCASCLIAAAARTEVFAMSAYLERACCAALAWRQLRGSV